MSKKNTLADYLGDLGQPRPKAAKSKPAKQAKPSATREPVRARVTIYLRRSLWEQGRTAALVLGAAGEEPATLSSLFDAALERELVRLAKAHNGGKPWSPHRSRLPGGRPPRRD